MFSLRRFFWRRRINGLNNQRGLCRSFWRLCRGDWRLAEIGLTLASSSLPKREAGHRPAQSGPSHCSQ